MAQPQPTEPDGKKPFTLATVADYTALYGQPEPDLAQSLEALLARASRTVRDELAADGLDVETLLSTGRVRKDTLTDVVVDMVAYAARSASSSFDAPFGASQASVTGGPYSQSATFASPVGSLSFTKVHRHRLGLPRARRAFEVDLLRGAAQ